MDAGDWRMRISGRAFKLLFGRTREEDAIAKLEEGLSSIGFRYALERWPHPTKLSSEEYEELLTLQKELLGPDVVDEGDEAK